MKGGFSFARTTRRTLDASPIFFVVGCVVEVSRNATTGGGGPRRFGTGGLLHVGFFAFDGTGFAGLLATGVLVLVGGAAGAGAVTGAVGA